MVSNDVSSSLKPRWAVTFAGAKSNQKALAMSSRGFFAAQAFAPQISQNHGLGKIALLSHPPPTASAKFPYALATAQATIVLADFAPKLQR